MLLLLRLPAPWQLVIVLLLLLGSQEHGGRCWGFARTAVPPTPPPAVVAARCNVKKPNPTASRSFILTSAVSAASTSASTEPSSTATEKKGVSAKQPTLGTAGTDDDNSAGIDDVATPPPTSESPLSDESAQRRLRMLDHALREFNSTSAAQLLQELSDLRSASPAVSEDVIDQLLARGPDRPRPPKSASRASRILLQVASALYDAAVRRPAARVLPARLSRRARMASLRRALDYSTPPPNEGAESDPSSSSSSNASMGQPQDTSGDEQRRRRRALVSLLRTLARPADADGEDDASYPYRGGVAIRYLERKAVRESKPGGRRRQADVDLTLRRPKGLETPTYTVVSVLPLKESKVEIRSYEPYSVCTVSMTKPRPENATSTDAQVNDPTTGGARAFGALAGYLFGKNRQQQAMSMTTPVISKPQRGMQQQASGRMEDGKVMSFVMPSQYWTRDGLATAPEPLEGSGVTLEYVEGGSRAVLMYGGYASQVETNKRKSMLLSALTKSEAWEAVPDEPIALAQYNDPFTPPWKRVNEVSVAVRPTSTRETNR